VVTNVGGYAEPNRKDMICLRPAYRRAAQPARPAIGRRLIHRCGRDWPRTLPENCSDFARSIAARPRRRRGCPSTPPCPFEPSLRMALIVMRRDRNIEKFVGCFGISSPPERELLTRIGGNGIGSLFVVGIGHDGSFLFCLSPNATPQPCCVARRCAVRELTVILRQTITLTMRC
jgi:hypothetical protein